MKKGLLSLLAVTLTIVSCQNYDDQFAELTGLVNTLSTEVAGLSQVQTQLTALGTTVSGLSSAVASLPTTDSTADLSGLTTDLAAAQTAIDEITLALADVSSAADLAVVTAALADVQEDVTTLLEADAVINQDITISNTANLEYASTLVAHSTDDPQVIVNGDVEIDTTSLTASETIIANEIAGKLKTVIGNVEITSAAALNLSNISFINGNYSVSGSDATDDSLVTITGGLTTNYSGPNDYTQLSEVGAVVITNAASATLVDFTGVTVLSLNAGTMTFANATSVNLGTAPVTSLTANKATTIETRMVTSAGVTISGTSATAIDVNQMTTSTGAISVTGSSTTIVHFDALTTVTGAVSTISVGEAHFGALTQASGAITIAATTAANFAALTDTDAASSIGGTTVFLTALASATGTLTLPNATTANLPAFSASTGNGVTATVATSANMVSAAVADLSLPKATSLTLTAQAENFTLTNADFVKLTTVDITGKDVTGVTTTAISLTSAATLTTITVGGEASTLTVAGAGPTSLTTSGNITGLTTTATKLATIVLGHTYITGDTAVVIDIQNSAASAIDMSAVSKVKTITLTGNSKLASIVGPSSTVLPEAGAAIAVTLGTNSLTAVYTEGATGTLATETTPAVAAVEPTITCASVSSILVWFSAAAANAAAGVATTTNIDIELVTVGTATPTILATAYTNDAYNQAKAVSNAGTISTAAERSEVQ